MLFRTAFNKSYFEVISFKFKRLKIIECLIYFNRTFSNCIVLYLYIEIYKIRQIFIKLLWNLNLMPQYKFMLSSGKETINRKFRYRFHFNGISSTAYQNLNALACIKPCLPQSKMLIPRTNHLSQMLLKTESVRMQ